MKQAVRSDNRFSPGALASRAVGYARLLALLAVIGGPALAGDTPANPAPVRPAASPVSAQTDAPQWRNLTPAQQQALAPLAGEWDTMDSLRKEKWLKIGNHFATMKPEEQQRAQEKMREWAKLTPEQRKIVRENYARSKKITPDQKSAQWQQYQQLPDDQKQKLAADAPHKKGLANLPTHAPVKTIPSIKTAPKPAGHSDTPNVTRKSMVEASTPPKQQENP